MIAHLSWTLIQFLFSNQVKSNPDLHLTIILFIKTY